MRDATAFWCAGFVGEGAPMPFYGIDVDRAFGVLIWRSRDLDVKLRVVADELVAAPPTAIDRPHSVRSVFDRILLNSGE
jgi:hypothetical protein